MKLKKLFVLPFILFFFLSIGLTLFLGTRYLLHTFKTDPHFVAVDYASYPKFILSEELLEYEDLIFGEKLNERFTLINGSDGVYDAKKKTISFVDDKDKLSIDGKLVYLKGKVVVEMM